MLFMPSRLVPLKRNGQKEIFKVSIPPLLGVNILSICVVCYGLWHSCSAGNLQG